MVHRHLRDVDQALDAVADLHESAEGDELGDAAVDELPDLVGVGELLPRVGLGGLERQADPLLREVDVEDLDLDLVAHRHDRRRVVDVLPRQLGDVHEAVHATQVDEGAEVHHRRHDATTPLARLQVDQELAPLLLLGLLEPGPSREDHVVAVAVELDDLGLDGPPHVRLQLANPPELDQRRREEATEPDVDDEAALHHLDDRAGDHLVGFLELLDRAPRPLVLGALLREDEPSVLVLLLEDKRLDLLAQGDDLARVDVVADRQLPHRDHAFGLEPDVEQDLVSVDLDHRALDEVPVVELDDRAHHGVLERGAVEVVLGDRPGHVAALGVEVAHRLGGQDCGGRGGGVLVGHGGEVARFPDGEPGLRRGRALQSRRGAATPC